MRDTPTLTGGSFARGNSGRFFGSGMPGAGGAPGGPAGGFPINPTGRTGGPTGGFTFRGPRVGGVGGALTFAGPNLPTLDPKLLNYLETHRDGARYLVATPTSGYASLFILKTGQPVLTLGGYQGWDKIPTKAQLSTLVSQGAIRFFLLSGTAGRNGSGLPGGQGRFFGGASLPAGINTNVGTANNSLFTWVSTHCTSVPSSAYTTAARASSAAGVPGAGGGRFGEQGPGQLYDCAAARTG